MYTNGYKQKQRTN